MLIMFYRIRPWVLTSILKMLVVFFLSFFHMWEVLDCCKLHPHCVSILGRAAQIEKLENV